MDSVFWDQKQSRGVGGYNCLCLPKNRSVGVLQEARIERIHSRATDGHPAAPAVLIPKRTSHIHAEGCLSVHESKDGEADRVRGMELAAQPIHSPL